MRLRAATALLVLLALPGQALAWDWRAAFAIRRDAEITPTLSFAATALLSLEHPATEVHGFGGLLRGAVGYVDDDKLATFEIAAADFHLVYRAERGRYDAGTFPSVTLFGLSSQLRLTPSLHLLYGAALARSGPFTHATAAGLTYSLGVAVPFIGRRAESMGDYRRSYLQAELVPLVGALLADLSEEGFFDFEHPTVQVGGEVALVGRLETLVGAFTAESRLSVSYHHQRSMYLRIGLRWTGHLFWRRCAGFFQSQYIVPLRPLRRHLSEDDQQLVYNHHLALTIGLDVILGDLPHPRPEQVREHRREELRGRWSENREERHERYQQRQIRREERLDERLERRDERLERRDQRPQDSPSP